MNFDDAPRSWSKDERYLFVQLQPQIRAIIHRHAHFDSIAVRRAQNSSAAARQRVARLRKEIAKLLRKQHQPKKEIANAK